MTGDELLSHLTSVNDERLRPVIAATDDATRLAAIEAVILLAQPIVRRVLGHTKTTSRHAEDVEDIEATVNLRLFRRLQLARLYEEEAIRSLDEFTATLTYNVVYDVLRRRFPERTRLKSRLRYLLMHDRRLAMWHTGGGLTCGAASWQGRDPLTRRHAIAKENASAAMVDSNAPAEALLAIFGRAGGALLFEDVVDLAAALWDVSDVERSTGVESTDKGPGPLDRAESRQYLAALWREIRELRPPQRAALLLNLRDEDGSNALLHLLSAGIATMDEIVAAIGLPRETLAAIWDELPVGDAAIAEILGLKRQQVINLRKAARERLARRMMT